MSIGEPQYIDNLVKIPLKNGQSLEVTPQECWQLSEKTHNYLIDNHTKFDPILIKTIKKNKASFFVSITKNLYFWKTVERNSWEPTTFKIFDDFLSMNCRYIDIGSWIGPTALYTAQIAKHTYAFEPDPVAFQEFKTNVHANKDADWLSRLTIYNKAIASSNRTVKIGSKSDVGDSMSSVLFSDKKENWEVEGITLEKFVESENLQNEELFIKMDVEGGEYELIPKLKTAFNKYNIVLFLSLHPSFLMDSLATNKNNKIRSKLSQRLLFVWHHIKIIRSLPFKYFYRNNGQRANFYYELLKALLTGNFNAEIVATNKEWNSA